MEDFKNTALYLHTHAADHRYIKVISLGGWQMAIRTDELQSFALT